MIPNAHDLQPAHVNACVNLGDGLYVLRLKPESSFPHQPGQYIQMQFIDKEGALLRYFSIANAPRKDGGLEFFIQPFEDRLTSALASLTDHTSIPFVSGLGNFCFLEPQRAILMVGGG